MVSAALTEASDASASADIIVVIFRIETASDEVPKMKIGGSERCPRSWFYALLRGDLLLTVADAPHSTVPVVGDQHRTVLHLHHVDRTADILVVLQEARDDRLDVLDRAVLVEMGDNDVTTELDGPIPRTMTRDDNLVLVGRREHLAGIETHAERGCVRTHQADRRRELAAGM